MKKLIAGILGICMMLGSMNFGNHVYASDDSFASSVKEDFEGGTVNTTLVSGSGTVVTDPTDATNKALKIQNATTSKNLYSVFINAGNALSDVPTEKAGRLIYEFKILFPSENTLTGNNPVSTYIKQWEGKRLGYIRPNFILNSSDSIILRTDMTNKWRTVRYVFNYSSETFDSYVDETVIETGTSFRNLSGANYYDPIERIFIRAHVPGGYIFYIDEVKVAYVEGETSMLNMITVNNKSVENFVGNRLNYEIEIDGDTYDGLSEDDIDVVLADTFSNATVAKTVYAEVDGTKTVMVTAVDWFCRATYTIICSRGLSPDFINNFATAEISEDFNGETYNTTLVSGSSGNAVVNDPLDASNKVMKVESNSTATVANKSLRFLYINAKDALQGLPDEKTGRLEYEFKILFPSENTLTADYPVAVKVKQYEGMTIANLRPNNVLYDSTNVVNVDGRNKWYTVRYLFDYSTGIYEGYCDDKQFAINVDFADVSNYYDPVEKLFLRTHTPAGYTYYVDDIKVSYKSEGYITDCVLTQDSAIVTVEDCIGVNIDMNLILAGYSGNKLEYIDNKEIQPSYSRRTYVFEEIDKNVNEIKLFLWTDELTPVAEMYRETLSDEKHKVSHTVTSAGKYRILCNAGNVDIINDGNYATVYKNEEEIWNQFFPIGEEGIIDIRLNAEEGDVLTVFFENEISTDCVFERFVGSIRDNSISQSVGHDFRVLNRKYLVDHIQSAVSGNSNVGVYALRYGYVKHQMSYGVGSNYRWGCEIEDSLNRLYILGENVAPGKNADILIEVPILTDGTIHVSGDLPVDSRSDGIETKLMLNGEVLWSSRVGGEESIRWDDAFDSKYFTDKIDAVANVRAGDVLGFSFGKWRTSDKDIINIKDIAIDYIDYKDNLLSDTTKWKLTKTQIISVDDNLMYDKDGNAMSVLFEVDCGVVYIDGASAKTIFGDDAILSDGKEINGNFYMPLEWVAEANGKGFARASDDLIVIYNGLSGFIGYTELNEIRTAFENGILYR